MTSAKCRSRENDAYHVVLHDNLIHDYKKKGPDAIEPGKRHLFTAYHKQIEALD